ncbi:MAG: sigma-70 family RNA polymerase sigma factor [candidate division Zixibacteria bacterium]|nr:sigma-70 family RNA polymerase sigma factor [candidate division Zixibacteria bacterium]
MHENRTLVERIKAGDNYAFERLIQKYQKLVSHIVFRMIPNQADREDLCQDVFFKVYKNLQNFRFDSKISTWIGRIAYNGCLNYLEKKRVPLYDDLTDDTKDFEQNISADPGPDILAENKDLGDILRKEIDKLPVKYRTIITLYHLDEMSYTEIADVMGLPEGTVKSYLFRARKALKDSIESGYRDEELWR